MQSCSRSYSAADFNPLSPHGERRRRPDGSELAEHFNPLSPHGERPGALPGVQAGRGISIHSPRMGRDAPAAEAGGGTTYFNPLSPHGERLTLGNSSGCSRNFNPLSPHGERRLAPTVTAEEMISIHSPRMGRDRPR